jgi:hypothetical protein
MMMILMTPKNQLPLAANIDQNISKLTAAESSGAKNATSKLPTKWSIVRIVKFALTESITTAFSSANALPKATFATFGLPSPCSSATSS